MGRNSSGDRNVYGREESIISWEIFSGKVHLYLEGRPPPLSHIYIKRKGTEEEGEGEGGNRLILERGGGGGILPPACLTLYRRSVEELPGGAARLPQACRACGGAEGLHRLREAHSCLRAWREEECLPGASASWHGKRALQVEIQEGELEEPLIEPLLYHTLMPPVEAASSYSLPPLLSTGLRLTLWRWDSPQEL